MTSERDSWASGERVEVSLNASAIFVVVYTSFPVGIVTSAEKHTYSSVDGDKAYTCDFYTPTSAMKKTSDVQRSRYYF